MRSPGSDSLRPDDFRRALPDVLRRQYPALDRISQPRLIRAIGFIEAFVTPITCYCARFRIVTSPLTVSISMTCFPLPAVPVP